MVRPCPKCKSPEFLEVKDNKETWNAQGLELRECKNCQSRYAVNNDNGTLWEKISLKED